MNSTENFLFWNQGSGTTNIFHNKVLCTVPHATCQDSATSTMLMEMANTLSGYQWRRQHSRSTITNFTVQWFPINWGFSSPFSHAWIGPQDWSTYPRSHQAKSAVPWHSGSTSCSESCPCLWSTKAKQKMVLWLAVFSCNLSRFRSCWTRPLFLRVGSLKAEVPCLLLYFPTLNLRSFIHWKKIPWTTVIS